MLNYQRELDKIIKNITNESHPKLLLHSCCAPCSSYVLEYLSEFFDITVLFYNPNIYPEGEYIKRVEELKNLMSSMPLSSQVKFQSTEYHPEEYFDIVKGHENEPEGGDRCFLCYELRLKEVAAAAKEGGFDYFTTTLSISPYKNAEKLNEIGERFAQMFGVAYLPSDFKKRNGYQRSIQLSREYGLYRQDYCGCIFSKKVRDLSKNDNEHK